MICDFSKIYMLNNWKFHLLFIIGLAEFIESSYFIILDF